MVPHILLSVPQAFNREHLPFKLETEQIIFRNNQFRNELCQSSYCKLTIFKTIISNRSLNRYNKVQ